MGSPQESKPLTPEDEFYLEWGRETQKASVSVAVETLQRLISLNGTMLGGSLLLWQSIGNATWMRPVCCALFLFALLAAFWGILPSSDRVNLDDPVSIKTFKEALLARRNNWVRASAVLTTIAFILALVALGYAAMSPTPPDNPPQKQNGANKALVPTVGAALSAMLSVTLTRYPVSTLTPAPAVGTA